MGKRADGTPAGHLVGARAPRPRVGRIAGPASTGAGQRTGDPPGRLVRVPGSPVDSMAAAVAANCLDEAYGILNAQAMFGLLPLLDALRTRPEYAAIRSSAAGMGGPRMLVAIKAVDLHAKGGPVTGPDLRDLIDQMGGLPPDQRRDILRFIGKYAVITDGRDEVGGEDAGGVRRLPREAGRQGRRRCGEVSSSSNPGCKTAAGPCQPAAVFVLTTCGPPGGPCTPQLGGAAAPKTWHRSQQTAQNSAKHPDPRRHPTTVRTTRRRIFAQTGHGQGLT